MFSPHWRNASVTPSRTDKKRPLSSNALLTLTKTTPHFGQAEDPASLIADPHLEHSRFDLTKTRRAPPPKAPYSLVGLKIYPIYTSGGSGIVGGSATILRRLKSLARNAPIAAKATKMNFLNAKRRAPNLANNPTFAATFPPISAPIP